MNKVELGELINGALQEKFDKSFERVVENLQDQNTSFKVKRSITIKLSFEQNEKRDDVSVAIDVTEKLAPQSGLKTSFYVGKDLKTGELFAEEYGKQIKGQMSFDDVGKNVDPETGEVLDNRSEKIIDFKKASY